MSHHAMLSASLVLSLMLTQPLFAELEAEVLLKKAFTAADKDGDGQIDKPGELASLLIKMNGPLLHANDMKKLAEVKITPEGKKRPQELTDAIRDLYRGEDPDTNADGAVSVEEFDAFVAKILKDRDVLIDLATKAAIPAFFAPAPLIAPALANKAADRDRDIADSRERIRRNRERLEEEREERERQRLLAEIQALELRITFAENAKADEEARAAQAANPNPPQENGDGRAILTRPDLVRPSGTNVDRLPVVGRTTNNEPNRREFSPAARNDSPKMEVKREPVRVVTSRPEPQRPEPQRMERRETVRVERSEPRKVEPKVEKKTEEKKAEFRK